MHKIFKVENIFINITNHDYQVKTKLTKIYTLKTKRKYKKKKVQNLTKKADLKKCQKKRVASQE